VVFALGFTPFRAFYSANLTLTNEAIGEYTYDLSITFDGSDWFVDAADLCDDTDTDTVNIQNNEEFEGGTPFYITVQWQETSQETISF
jgi:hypothetical protein